MPAQSLSHVRLFVTPWTVAHQAPLSMGFSREEYWSGLLCPSPGDLPNPGIKPTSPALQADSVPTEPLVKPHIRTATYQLITSKDLLHRTRRPTQNSAVTDLGKESKT